MFDPVLPSRSPFVPVAAAPPAATPCAIADRPQDVHVLHVIEVLKAHSVYVGLVLHFV